MSMTLATAYTFWSSLDRQVVSECKHVSLFLAALFFVMACGPRMQAAAQGIPDAMQAGEEGLLARPDDLDQWIFLGATVGHGPVREGDSRKFSADDPGQILSTPMEPGA